MEFFDCNVSYGIDAAANDLRPVPTAGKLREEMKRAGVARAVAWRVEQFTGCTITANAMLANDIGRARNLYGTWAIVPSHTHEMPAPEKLVKKMRARRIAGWRLFPSRSRFLARAFVLRDWFAAAVRHRIPVFVNTAHGTKLEDLAEVLAEFPELTVVLTYASDWPSDRLIRPFVAEFPNVYVDMSCYITDGGVESFVSEYGARRLLYGSGFPGSYFGANMLMVRHARIPEEDRNLIASGNMKRIIEPILTGLVSGVASAGGP